MSGQEAIGPKEKELKRLVEHRLLVAIRLGFTIEDAEMVAASSLDLHDLERLVKVGCPPKTALSILF